LTNTLSSSPNCPGASLHQTHGFLPPGFLPPSVHFDPPYAVLKTSGNVLTLLQTGPPSSLSATNTTSSSCLPKRSTTPVSYLQPQITPNVFGKQSTNSYTANPPHRYQPLRLAFHLHIGLLLFFTGKIFKLRLSFTSNPATSYHTHPLLLPLPLTSVFTFVSESEVHKILSNCPNKQSDSDPILIWLLRECSSVLVPAI